MASTTSALSAWPLVGYFLLAILLAYLVLRVFRHIKVAARSSGSLPKPVSGAVPKSAFSFARSTGWNWREWAVLPRVPAWSKVPEAVRSKAKSVANAKSLTVDLLPTTALPPHPTSLPTPTPTPTPASMPTPQLVDLSTPALTTGSSSMPLSYPNTPRTSPPHPQQLNMSTVKPIYPSHPSYPRPPSPHALLATTSPSKPHRRSRSLGGVPVRRLSSGTSGLRNAVQVELKEMTHVRDTSREHLLIDFSSSASSDEEYGYSGGMKVSPVASDIGVVPLGKEIVDPRTLGRHMSLVDLGDEVFKSDSPKMDENGWKWFSTGPVASLSYGYGMRSLMDSKPKQLGKFPQTEKLVDVDTEPHSRPQLASGTGSIQVNRVELSAPNRAPNRQEQLVDLSDPKAVKEAQLVDLTDDNYEYGNYVDGAEHIRLVDIDEPMYHAFPPPLRNHTPVLVKAAFSHPLDDLVHVDTRAELPLSQKHVPLTSEKVDAQHGLLFAGSETQQAPEPQAELEQDIIIKDPSSSVDTMVAEPPSPLIILQSHLATDTDIESQGGWAWDAVDVDDPWGNHVVAPSPIISTSTPEAPPSISSPEPDSDSDVFIYTGVDAEGVEENDSGLVLDAPELLPVKEVLEKSPGASLFATVLPDDDDEDVEDMPPLDLDMDLKTGSEKPDQDRDEVEESKDEEEDNTPKPTPTSEKQVEFPALSSPVDTAVVQVPVIVVQDQDHPELEITETADVKEVFPDPDLLPLPESPLLLLSVDTQLAEASQAKDNENKVAPCQTPTPPASPPPITGLRFVVNRSQPPSPSMRSMKLLPSPRVLAAVPLPSNPPSAILSAPPQLLVAVDEPTNDTEDKENETPTALSAGADSKAFLSVNNGSTDVDAPSALLPLSLLSSPGVRRRNLVKDEAMEEPVVSTKDEETKSDENHDVELSSALPGSFPEPSSTTIAARLALAPNTLPRPSARALMRSPLDIALAMQLRPGLGAGADPAWMVRFLMAMFGWLAVVVSGGEHF